MDTTLQTESALNALKDAPDARMPMCALDARMDSCSRTPSVPLDVSMASTSAKEPALPATRLVQPAQTDHHAPLAQLETSSEDRNAARAVVMATMVTPLPTDVKNAMLPALHAQELVTPPAQPALKDSTCKVRSV
jgi:hypothetical protein